MQRVSEFIAQNLVRLGIKHVFMLTGGGAMFLNDAFGHCDGLSVICCHHEQACAMAAEGYARVTESLGVVCVTTGPGGINALNGVFGAWTDSIPMLIISGQVKRETCLGTYPSSNLRQLGDQEANIISIVNGITKYAFLVDDPQTIRYHLEKAILLAISGRPGPCWLDIPVDVQSSIIDDDNLPGYDPTDDVPKWDIDLLSEQCRIVIQRIQTAKRPVIVAGSGIRHAHALEAFEEVIRLLAIPVTTAWTHDLIASDDPLFCGRPGTIGDRAGNFTVQNADLLVVIGSRLNIRQVSYNWKSFARCAYKIQVDVDNAELSKPTIMPDMPIHSDARFFLEVMKRQLKEIDYHPDRHISWLAWCKERRARYPVVLPNHLSMNGQINPYHFIDALFHQLAHDDIVVAGNASACVITYQVAKIKKGQRLFSNSGSASMGYDLPAAIGASVAAGGKRVICLAGDGSIQLNIQELQTIIHHQLPIKIFVLNNGGYLSIRQTQSNFFGRMVGESPESGVSFPDMVKVGDAYGLSSFRISNIDFINQIDQVLNIPGPVLCEVMLDPKQFFEPRITSKQLPDGRIISVPLEDMYPFLSKDELLENLLVPPLES